MYLENNKINFTLRVARICENLEAIESKRYLLTIATGACGMKNGKNLCAMKILNQIVYKVNYSKTQGLGAIMFWQLSGDDRTLLLQLHQVLHEPSTP